MGLEVKLASLSRRLVRNSSMFTSYLSSSVLLNSRSCKGTKFGETDENVQANNVTGSSSTFGFMVRVKVTLVRMHFEIEILFL